ncbi:MAG: prolipoprotein diacylglyceryl transferase [Alloprevotella sp.]|nr:prolipoprotein diacylglyceryl transferase [Alloprevotella sp.]
MLPSALAVVWNPSRVAFSLFGHDVLWYGVMWVVGLALAYAVVYRLYKDQKLPQEKFEPLFLYCFCGILIGARLGHCLLYEPGYFLSHPVEMFLPVRQSADGGWRCTGYAGLASHGGTLGLMIALWLYVRKCKVNLMRVLDNIAIATPVTATFIRLGNLMNSEIVGKPTDSPLGFIFVQNGENFARYPGQLFEAGFYLLLFPVGLLLYRRFKAKVGTGFYFGWVLTCIFGFRFLVEFLKDVQEPWELDMVSAIGLNQGQMLSVPFFLLGLYCWLGGKYCKKLGETK